MSGTNQETAAPVRLSLGTLAALFAFTAVMLSICDGFHTYSGTTRYTHEVAWKAAWWTPMNFGLAGAVGGPLYAFFYSTFGGRRVPPSLVKLAPGFVAFGALYYFSGFYKGPNEVKLAVLGGSAAVLFAVYDRTVAGFLCLLITSATGPIIEIIFVKLELFLHLQPDFLGVPMWLPALYACSAPVIGQGCRRVLCRSA
ncbi:MAG: hypothetical protein ACAI25_08240 [Planctomycetota bacterium]